MPLDFKPGTAIRVTISRSIKRASALKTLERLFMQDRAIAKPIEVRSRNFKDLPKRRGGQIWTKRPNKVFPTLTPGFAATLKATPQVLRDLGSVLDFIQVSAG
jgi:hypothetical protein